VELMTNEQEKNIRTSAMNQGTGEESAVEKMLKSTADLTTRKLTRHLLVGFLIMITMMSSGAREQRDYDDEQRPAPLCFPGDALLSVFDFSTDTFKMVEMSAVRPDEHVLVGHESSMSHSEPVLLELHSPAENSVKNVEFLRIVHDEGVLDVTADHFLRSLEHGMVPARELAIGDHLYAIPRTLSGLSAIPSKDVSFLPSRILTTERINKDGLFSKLTFSGKIVVNGVIASNYAMGHVDTFVVDKLKVTSLVETIGYDGINYLIHVLTFPLRVFHTYAPRQWRMSQFWSPSDLNAHRSVAGSGQPMYVDVVGRYAGHLLQIIL